MRIILGILYILSFAASSMLSANVGSVELKLGQSTNPLQEPGSPASTYVEFSPSYLIVKDLSDDFSVLLDASLRARHYFDELISNNGNFVSGSIMGGLSHFPSKWLEYGVDLAYARYEGRDLSVVPTDIAGRLSRSNLYKPSLYARQKRGAFSLREKLEVNILRFEDKTSDEALNLFRDDRNEWLFQLALEYRREFFQSVLEFNSSQRNYLERRARFTEGTPTISTPQLEELEYALRWKSALSVGVFNFEVSPAYTLNKDKIKGANDSTQLEIEAALKVALSLVDIKIAAKTARKEYQHFVAQLFTNPMATEKRVDKSSQASVEFSVPIASSRLSLKFSQQALKSNYPEVPFSETLYEMSWEMPF